jgi:hypothetical protein
VGIIQISFFFFLGTLFKEYFTQNFFFFLVIVVILHIVIGGLVKYSVVIVVAVWVFVSDSACLNHGRGSARTRRGLGLDLIRCNE